MMMLMIFILIIFDNKGDNYAIINVYIHFKKLPRIDSNYRILTLSSVFNNSWHHVIFNEHLFNTVALIQTFILFLTKNTLK